MLFSIHSLGRRAALSLAILALAAAPALAQLPAGHKITGGYKSFWSQKSASRGIRHAQESAAAAHEYLAHAAQPDPKVVEEMAAETMHNLETAKKHFAAIRKDHAGDKETLAAIDSIEKHLTAAMENHGKLCDCCQDKDFQAIMAMECCNEMSKAIDAALSEHDALMRKLATQAAANAKKPPEKAK